MEDGLLAEQLCGAGWAETMAPLNTAHISLTNEDKVRFEGSTTFCD